jgi:hypothetical protein
MISLQQREQHPVAKKAFYLIKTQDTILVSWVFFFEDSTLYKNLISPEASWDEALE